MSAIKEHYHEEIEAGMRPDEHPILFSTEMVKAILEGRKTMTRRVVKPQKNQKEWLTDSLLNKAKSAIFLQGGAQIEHPFGGPLTFIKCPYGEPGDLLWVRETWQTAQSNTFYLADGEVQSAVFKWRPSIHMPKEAARIWLQVEEVRVERLQAISEEDAIAEGVTSNFNPLFQEWRYYDYMDIESEWRSAVSSFRSLWYKINGIESWHENPWVWVIKYKVLSTTGKPSFPRSIGAAQDDGSNGAQDDK